MIMTMSVPTTATPGTRRTAKLKVRKRLSLEGELSAIINYNKACAHPQGHRCLSFSGCYHPSGLHITLRGDFTRPSYLKYSLSQLLSYL